ncbi:hypothetical protein ACF1UB_002316 [Vibrio fluvialis]
MTSYVDLKNMLMARDRRNYEWNKEIKKAVESVSVAYGKELNMESYAYRNCIVIDKEHLNSDDAINDDNHLLGKFKLTIELDNGTEETINIQFLVRNNNEGISYSDTTNNDEWIFDIKEFARNLVDKTVLFASSSNYELS